MDKRVYERCKVGMLTDLRAFEKYVDEVDKEATKLKYERFSKMFDNIKDNLQMLSSDEINSIISIMTKDRDVPDVLTEIVSGIGVIKYVNENIDKPEEQERLIKLMLSFMNKGGE